MPLFLTELPGSASGNILPSAFVSCNTSSSVSSYLQSNTNDMPIGIAQEGINVAPNLITALSPSTTTTDYAASKSQELQIFFCGDVCLLTAGSAGWTNGDLLGPDANGYGYKVPSNSYYGAKALSSASSGDLGMVLVVPGKA